MRMLCLNREDSYRGDLILVNRSFPLHGAAQPGRPEAELVLQAQSLEKKEGPEAKAGALAAVGGKTGRVLLGRRAASALERALRELGAQERIVPVSGYRSRREQEEIYRDSLEENGAAFTRKYVALPDRSEHQTGLAIDLGEGGRELDFIRPSFPEEGICGRFRRAAADYGFILRYPAGKEAVTGIAHEPWHFRYVGRPHARIMEERGLVLEEYLDFLRGQPGGVFVWEEEGRPVEIRFVEAEEGREEVCVPLPEGCLCEASGDNRGGFVLTVRRGD